jgi:hypothetical protein
MRVSFAEPFSVLTGSGSSLEAKSKALVELEQQVIEAQRTRAITRWVDGLPDNHMVSYVITDDNGLGVAIESHGGDISFLKPKFYKRWRKVGSIWSTQSPEIAATMHGMASRLGECSLLGLAAPEPLEDSLTRALALSRTGYASGAALGKPNAVMSWASRGTLLRASCCRSLAGELCDEVWSLEHKPNGYLALQWTLRTRASHEAFTRTWGDDPSLSFQRNEAIHRRLTEFRNTITQKVGVSTVPVLQG